eukprot:365509-Chlamydomonas_euryale.AAC.24
MTACGWCVALLVVRAWLVLRVEVERLGARCVCVVHGPVGCGACPVVCLVHGPVGCGACPVVCRQSRPSPQRPYANFGA